MTSLSHTKPFASCPDKTLIQSKVVNSSFMYPDQSACLSTKPLFDDADLRQKCPYAKTQEHCMDRLRSQGIFKNLIWTTGRSPIWTTGRSPIWTTGRSPIWTTGRSPISSRRHPLRSTNDGARNLASL